MGNRHFCRPHGSLPVIHQPRENLCIVGDHAPAASHCRDALMVIGASKIPRDVIFGLLSPLNYRAVVDRMALAESRLD